MVKASDFVAAVIAEYERGCGYIWGTVGQTWTEALQKKGSKENNANTQAYGRRWLGYTVYDCSGLPYAMLKKLGLNIPHGCNSIYDKGYLSEKGKLSAFPPEKRLPGMAVFLADGSNEHHMGTYIGGGWCIEARGTKYGVTISRWEHWDEAGYYKGVDYDLPADWTPAFQFELVRPTAGSLPTIRRGEAGPYARYLQLLMLHSGHAVTVDNEFGAEVLAWVRSFQEQHGLAVDGVVGPKTWAALEQLRTEQTAPDDSVPSITEYLRRLRSLNDQLSGVISELETMQKGDTNE